MIPAAFQRHLRPLLTRHRLRQPARLGLQFRRVPEGVLVTKVTPGAGADRAGLRPGDLLLTADGKALPTSNDDVRAAFARVLQPARMATVTVGASR